MTLDNHWSFRPAVREDVPELVRTLADDELGATREFVQAGSIASKPAATPGQNTLREYYEAFDAIESSVDNDLLVMEDCQRIVGFLQITFIPYLTYRGGQRCLIESVRVVSDSRGSGIGSALLSEAVARAGKRGCHMVQLTTNKLRTDAIGFYLRHGFIASHEGMKLEL